MFNSTNLFKSIAIMVVLLLLVTANVSVALAIPASFDWGSFNSTGLTTFGVYDLGNTLILQTGDLAQLIWAGSDGLISPPLPNGNPGGDDQLLDSSAVENVGTLPPPARNKGYVPLKTYSYDTDNPQSGGVVIIRAWNSNTAGSATAYGDSVSSTLSNGAIFNAARWSTNIKITNWIGPVGGTWGDGNNWSGGALPDASSYVVVPSGASILLGADRGCYSLYLSDNSILDIGTFQLSVEAGLINNGTLRQSGVVDSTCTGGSPCRFLQITNVAGNTTFYRGLEINTTNNLGIVSVDVRGIDPTAGEYCTTTGATSPSYAKRCFKITASNNLSATVKLWSLTTELNGIAAGSLAPYRYVPASAWVKLTGITTGNDGGRYTFVQGDTPGFSYFVMGDTNSSPTAISLTEFDASSIQDNNFVLLSGLSVIFIGAVLILGLLARKRREII